MKKILLIGYGNPGRLDDGLGPALAEKIRAENLTGVTVESNYQLNIEDVAQIAEHDVVIFADASVNAAPPYTFTRLEAEQGGPSFSSHSVSTVQLLGMAEDLFKAKPEGWMLAIRGYDFNEFGERLSVQARQNLKAAAEFLEKHLSITAARK